MLHRIECLLWLSQVVEMEQKLYHKVKFVGLQKVV